MGAWPKANAAAAMLALAASLRAEGGERRRRKQGEEGGGDDDDDVSSEETDEEDRLGLRTQVEARLSEALVWAANTRVSPAVFPRTPVEKIPRCTCNVHTIRFNAAAPLCQAAAAPEKMDPFVWESDDESRESSFP